MRRMFLVGILCLLAGGVFIQVKSQTMLILKADGLEQSVDLSVLQNFMLPTGSLVLNYIDKTNDSFSLSDVIKLVFDSGTGFDNEEVSGKLSLYPNPATDNIFISGFSSINGDVSLYRIDGKMLCRLGHAQLSNGIDVSGLVPGVYFIKVGNDVIKFVKR